jgi:hypothetical protein
MNRYKTPAALRRAPEDRLLASVRRDGGDIQRLRRPAAFTNPTPCGQAGQLAKQLLPVSDPTQVLRCRASFLTGKGLVRTTLALRTCLK